MFARTAGAPDTDTNIYAWPRKTAQTVISIAALNKLRSHSNEWNYVLFTLGAFVFAPEIRRVFDWRIGFDPLNAFAVIPLVLLCPVAIMALRRRARLQSRDFAIVMLLWVSAFGYATLVAAAHGAIIQAVYADAQFCLPAIVGFWLITRDETMEVAHLRLARALLIYGTIAATYGIFQYVVAPPWDTAWMQNIGAESFGVPERFGIRVFGVLNGPGVFALFLASVVLFNLPYFKVQNWYSMAALLMIIVALMLSLVRTAWLEVLLGAAIFIWLSPRRIQAFLSISSVVVTCGLLVSLVVVASPDPTAGDTIFKRFATLGAIQDDGSARGRQETALTTFKSAINQPVGAGLGLTGGSDKLGNSDAALFEGAPAGAIDNGFVSRLFEMGWGFCAFMMACFVSIACLFRAHFQFLRERDTGALLVCASCISAQLVIFAVNFSGDDQQGLLGTLFFAASALPLLRSDRADLQLSETTKGDVMRGLFA